MCFDSASDSYPIFDFLLKNNVIPIIDINTRAGSKNPYQKYNHLNEKGIPVCLNRIPMIYYGYEHKRHRHKYRCPLAMGKIDKCPFKEQCSKSEYGKTIYIKSSDDPRLFGEVPYKSDKWKKIYKNRTSTERMNNRILNDYHLHSMKIRNQSKFLFFAIMAGINIHLDARVKFDS